jgi:large subunit ribosomal protein L31
MLRQLALRNPAGVLPGFHPSATRTPGDEERIMKQGIHPEYIAAKFTCSCGNVIETRGVVAATTLELCNECHPFYTGKQKLVDTGGRVDRFKKRMAKAGS